MKAGVWKVILLVFIVAVIWEWNRVHGSSSQPVPVAAEQDPGASSLPTLQEAIASGVVTAEFQGNGGSSGDTVRLKVAKGPNASPGTVELSIPPGSVLTSGDPSAQSMMVAGLRGIDLGGNRFRPATRIVLTDSQPVAYVLAAYCIQFDKENPSSATTFTLERPDPALACIAKTGPSLTVPALQAAVWMRTDNMAYAHMSEKFQVSSEDWAAGRSVFQQCLKAPDSNTVTLH